MKRKLITKLFEWKESSDSRPILLTGARSVGKTYLVYDFARSFYTEYAYINVETDPFLYGLMLKHNPSQIEDGLKDYFHLSGSSGPVLLILDEITVQPDLTRILKLLADCNTSFQIIVISSHRVVSIPNDKDFYQLCLFPLDFEEFLVATGNEWYIEVITVHFKNNSKIPEIVHQELLTLFDLYLEIGGMPLAVNEYLGTNSVYNVSEQHRILVSSFISDTYNRTMEGDFLKISQVFNTIGRQLMKENRKFQYKLIRKGATQAQYSDALWYIQNSGYGMCCYKIPEESEKLPVSPAIISELLTEVQNNENGHISFKLYMFDTGILSSVLKTSHGLNDEQNRKGLLENYVAQSLASRGYPLLFWESGSQAKVDFIISKDNKFLPIEVRTTDNTRSRNVSIFRKQFPDIAESIKISTRNFEFTNHVKYVPVYAVFCI